MITIFSLSFCIVPQDRKTRSAQCSRQFSLCSMSRVRKLANRLRTYAENTLWINALAVSIAAYAHLANRLKTCGYMPSLSPFQTRRILRTDSRRVATCPHSLHFRRGASCEQTQDVWLHAFTLSISDEAHLADRLKTCGYMPSLSPFQTRRILRTDSRRVATCPHSLHFSLRPVPPVRSRSPVQHGGGRRKP